MHLLKLLLSTTIAIKTIFELFKMQQFLPQFSTYYQ